MSQGQYTKFTSFDRPDGAGVRAQVFVTEVTAPIKAVDRGEQVTKVSIDAEAIGLQYGIDAYATNESPWIDALEQSVGTGQPVTLRIETKRKAKDKAKQPINRRLALKASTVVPADQVLQNTNTNTARALVGVNGTLGPEALTSPDEDLKWRDMGQDNVPAFIDVAETPQHAPASVAGGSTSATGPAVDAAAAAASLERLAKTGGQDPLMVAVTHAFAVMDANADLKALDALAHDATQVTGAVRSGRLRELQPWFTYTQDGRVNLASYAVGGAQDTVAWAETFLSDRGALIGDPAADMKQITFLADGVMAMADQVQIGVYAATHGRDVTADRNASSHKYARRAVKQAVTARWEPLHLALHDGSYTQIAQGIIDVSVERLALAATLADVPNPTPTQWGVATGPDATIPEPTPARETADDQVADSELSRPIPEPAAPVDEMPADLPAPEPAMGLPVPEPAPAPAPAGSVDAAPWNADDLGPLTVDDGGTTPNVKDIDGWTKLLAFASLSGTDPAVADFLITSFGTDTFHEVAAPRASALLEHLRAQGDVKNAVTELQRLLGTAQAA